MTVPGGEDTGLELSPPGEGDPLVALGLVDAKSGAALPTTDWKPPEGYPGPADAGGDAAGTDQGQPPADKPPADQWESDDNPYKGKYTELSTRVAAGDPSQTAPQQLQQRLQALETERQGFHAQLVNQGINGQKLTPEVATLVANAAYIAAAAQAQTEADRAALMPVAREAVARRIAQEHGVKFEDILNEPTVEAMQARARTLKESGRNQNFAARKAAGTDSAEGGAPAGGVSPEAISSLSPFSKIALGVRRGEA